MCPTRNSPIGCIREQKSLPTNGIHGLCGCGVHVGDHPVEPAHEAPTGAVGRGSCRRFIFWHVGWWVEGRGRGTVGVVVGVI